VRLPKPTAPVPTACKQSRSILASAA
jgi:hypothetical protein